MCTTSESLLCLGTQLAGPDVTATLGTRAVIDENVASLPSDASSHRLQGAARLT
jgi:hypothetical protein